MVLSVVTDLFELCMILLLRSEDLERLMHFFLGLELLDLCLLFFSSLSGRLQIFHLPIIVVVVLIFLYRDLK